MSPKDPKEVLNALKKLRERSDAGDLQARGTLQRVLAGAKQFVQRKQEQDALLGLVSSGALDHLLVDDGEQIRGDHGQEMTDWRKESRGVATSGEEPPNDELDEADSIMRAMPTADGLAHKAAIKGFRHAQLNEAAPFIRQNPVSILKGTLGQQATVWTGDPLDSDQPRQQQVALWQGDDADTTGICVTFAPTTAPPALSLVAGSSAGITSVPLFPFGIIRFGTRGMSVAFEVDIGNGCQFSLTGSNVSVQVALENLGSGSPVSMDLAGMISFMPTFRAITPITRTRIVAENLGVGVTPVPVPLFAKTLNVWRSGLALFQFSFFDSTGTSRYTYIIPAGGYLLDAIPIAGDITTIGVSGPNGEARLIFNLGF